jgi:Ca2+-binding RTX toxin-like protein
MAIYEQRGGGEILVNTATAGNQDNPRTVRLSDGRFVIVWRDFSMSGGDTSGAAIRAQVFNADGSRFGGEILVNTATTGDQWHPAIAALSDGRFVIGWTEYNAATGDGNGLSAKAQMFDASGAKAGGEIVLNTSTAGAQSMPAMAALAGGGFVATWHDSLGDGNSTGVKAQLFTASGVKAGAEFSVNTTTSGFQQTPTVATLADGRFVIVFVSGASLRAQMFNADGTRSGIEFQVGGGQSVEYPSVAALEGGGFVVAWTDWSENGGGPGVRAQMFTAAGAPSGSFIPVNSEITGYQNGVAVAAMPGGGFAVTWTDASGKGVDTSGTGAKGRIYDASGAPATGEFLLHETITGNQAAGGIAVVAGALVAVWTDSSATGGDLSGSAVKFRRFVESSATEAGEAIFGTEGRDTIHGLGGNDLLYGLGADDTLRGGTGNDTLFGGEGNDLLEGEAGADTLLGEGGNDELTGGEGDDELAGGDGNDVISGDAGNDRVGGGAGDDSFIHTASAAIETDSADGGAGLDILFLDYQFITSGIVLARPVDDGAGGLSGTVQSAAGHSFSFTGIEGFFISGSSAADQIAGGGLGDILYGRGGDDVLDGGGGNDELDGMSGNDRMIGGAGNDTFTLDNAADQAVEDADGGTDTVKVSFSYTLGAHLENLIASGTAGLTLTGNGAVNSITGTQGADLIDGGAGADVLSGGIGNDVYLIDDNGDRIVEDYSGGFDEARVWAKSFSVAFAGVEKLTGMRTDGQELIGNAGANTLVGNVGNDRLDGGAGTDRMEGGAGDDTYVVDDRTDVVVETAGGGRDTVVVATTAHYTLPDHIEEGHAGVSQNAIINGNALDNVIRGSAGWDTLNGGLGADTLIGLGGNDWYYVDNVGDVVIEAAGGGSDTVETTLSYYKLGAEVDLVVGNASKQTLVGNDGDNWLDSKGGGDTLIGGLGNDLYVTKAGDILVEYAGEGIDLIRTELASFTLPEHFEELQGTSFSIGQTLIGNAANNRIIGTILNDRTDVIDGGLGADLMIGYHGSDIYYVDDAGDSIVEEAHHGTADEVRTTLGAYTLGLNLEKLTGLLATGQALTGNGLANTILGGDGADTIVSGAGNDVVNGGAGDDVVTGGAGADILSGGAGADRFVYTATSDSVSVIDQIMDFEAGVDKIDLTALGPVRLFFSEQTVGTEVRTWVSIFVGATEMAISVNGRISRSDVLSDARILGTANGDQLQGTDGADHIDGLGGDDQLFGLGANDILVGGLGNDRLDGGAGADAMTGGAGNDVYIVDDAGDTVTENPNEGTDEIRTALAVYSLANAPNVERLTGTASTGQVLGGDAGANIITGGSGNDTIDAGGGNDMVDGGAGDDIFRDSDLDSGTSSTINGNAGLDTLDLSAYDTPLRAVTVDASSGVVVNGETRVTGVERFVGGSAGDIISLFGAPAAEIYGGAGNDYLQGGSGHDKLYGEAGNDTFHISPGDYADGGEGDDLLEIGLGVSATPVASTLLGGAGTDILKLAGRMDVDLAAGTAVSGNATYLVSSFEIVEAATSGFGARSTVRGSDAAETFRVWTLEGTSLGIVFDGRGGDDHLTGSNGNDELTGGAGADRIRGGEGADRFVYLSASDSTQDALDILLDFQTGIDTLDLTALGRVRVTLTPTSDPATGAPYTLVGVAVGGETMAIRVEGTIARSDLLADTGIAGTAGDDTLEGTAEADEMFGEGGNDTLLAHGGNDLLEGGAGDDLLDGGEGADTMRGNGGDDIFLVDEDGDLVTEQAGEGNDEVRTALAAYTLGAHVERLTGAAASQALTGNALANRIDGGAGADAMSGLDGNDLYIVDDAGDQVIEAAGEGTDEVRTALASYSLTANVENLTGTSATGQTLTGNGLDNILFGGMGDDTLVAGSGNDILIGFGGSDVLRGQAGDDVYIIDAGDTVVELAGDGIDEVRTQAEIFVLTGAIENLRANSEIGHDFRGNELNNVIVGAAGNDVFRAQDGGGDLLFGLGGVDSFYMGGAFDNGDLIDGGDNRDSLILQGNYAGLTLTWNITGGSSIANIEGISLLSGSVTHFGQSGTNLYSYNLTLVDGNIAAGALMKINGFNLQAGENFTLNASAETDAPLQVFAGFGIDNLTGGQQGDAFIFGHDGRLGAGDRVDGGGGYDVVYLRGDYTLDFNAAGFETAFTNVESLAILTSANSEFAGGGDGDFDYTITWADGLLAAGATFTVNASRLQAHETFVFDGSKETDGVLRVFGGASADTLTGGGSSTQLHGGGGADVLNGGAGTDLFRYSNVADSNAASTDTVHGFVAGTDKIDVGRVDAKASTADLNEAFIFIGSNAFSAAGPNAPGQLRTYNVSGDLWRVEGDVNGDGVADLVIDVHVEAGQPLTAGDFIV